MKSCILNFQIALNHIIVARDPIYQFIKPFRMFVFMVQAAVFTEFISSISLFPSF